MSEEIATISPVEPDWKAIEERYLDGEEVKSIAADYGITPGSICSRAWRNHWRDRQFKMLEQNKKEVEREVKGCLTISLLKDARAFQRSDPPSDPAAWLTVIKARQVCLATAAQLFGWDDDPLAAAKTVKCLDV